MTKQSQSRYAVGTEMQQALVAYHAVNCLAEFLKVHSTLLHTIKSSHYKTYTTSTPQNSTRAQESRGSERAAVQQVRLSYHLSHRLQIVFDMAASHGG